MRVTAEANFIRMSPRKVRLVVDLIRGKDVERAQHELMYINKKATIPVLKLLNSAIANAENNFHLKKDNLLVEKISVDQGPSLKRYTARAFGRAAMIRKPSSHIAIVLGEKKPTKAKTSKQATKPTKKREEVVVAPSEVKRESVVKKEAPQERPKDKPSRSPLGMVKRIFTRRLGER